MGIEPGPPTRQTKTITTTLLRLYHGTARGHFYPQCLTKKQTNNDYVLIYFVCFLGATLAQERGRLDVQIESQQKEIATLLSKLTVSKHISISLQKWKVIHH